MKAGAGLLPHFLHRKDPAAEISNLGKFFLYLQQPFLPLAVTDLSLGPIPSAKTIFLIQALNFSDLGTETCHLLAKYL